MTALPDRNDREGWFLVARDIYLEHRKPGWRDPLPKQTRVKSQSVLFALMYSSPHGAEIRDTGERMYAFLQGWGRWLDTAQANERASMWTLLEMYSTGPGSLVAATPEAACREALRSVPRDVALRLVLRLACELAEGVRRQA